MMNRRNALGLLAAGALGGLGSFQPKLGRLLQAAAPATSSTPAQEQASDAAARANVDEHLRKDLADLATREYSEQGVPVLLACQDLVAERKLAKTTEVNAAIASQFRQNAAAWQRLKPDAPDSDVAKLIEVLADRDFANGGKEPEPPKKLTFNEHAGELAELFASRPLIRAVNFHNTSRAQAAQYDRQLAEYSRSFSSVNEKELEDYLVTGEWHKPKPGLIVSVFEGYRNSYEVLLPMIEKYGFVAWFFMITNFINSPVADQLNYAEHHDIDMLTHEYPDGRYALTWDQLREIDKKHVIASHTRSHTLLSALPPAVQREEVIGSQSDFQKELGHPVRSFVSLTGPAYGETPAIDRLIDEAGYGLVFSNFRIQRIRAGK